MPEQLNPYSLGTAFPVMPIAPIPEHCLSVPAGAVTLVVEARELVPDPTQSDDTPQLLAGDFGASLHVNGTSDGVEYLRFDCFAMEPHYHYIRPAEQVNVICRFDDIAEGNPIEWTLGRLRHRLPEMLEYAGASSLVDAVRSDMPSLLASVETVGDLLEEADRRARARQTSGVSLAPTGNG